MEVLSPRVNNGTTAARTSCQEDLPLLNNDLPPRYPTKGTPINHRAASDPRRATRSHARWNTSVLLFVTCQLVVVFLVRCFNGAIFSKSLCLGGGSVEVHTVALTSPTNDATSPPKRPKFYSSDQAVFDGVVSRAFEPWSRKGLLGFLDKPLPCFPAERDWRWKQEAPATRGFIFVKPYKTGSSTVSGVNLRMARNIAIRQNVLAESDGGNVNASQWHMCQARSEHAYASDKYRDRDPDQTWMWTILREPSARLVSQFFHFRVSRGKADPTDENFRTFMYDPFFKDYYLRALSLNKFEIGHQHNESTAVEIANQIMREYNFVAVTERLDESIVAMTMLLKIPLADALYMKVKSRGSYDDGGGRGKDRKCTFIWPSFVTSGMQEELDSEFWRNKSRWDRALHQAANRSLDLTIRKLGIDKFEAKMELYRTALARSHELCFNRTVFPCSTGGKVTPWDKTDCLWNDSGCGYKCLDEVADELNLWNA